jgi:uncharacterized protein
MDPLRLWTGLVVDADVHAVVPSVEALYPYLDDVWIQHVEEREWKGPSSAITYPPRLPSTARSDWRPSDGAVPASSVAMLQRDVLDQWNVERVIVNCVYPIDGGPPDLSVALASAANDWLIAEWLEVDERLRASLVLPTRDDPAAMAAEVDRVGGHPGFVQALLPARSGKMYGKRLYWPVFEAIARNDLVAGIHWGGSNDGIPPTPSGWPSWFIEEYTGEVQIFEVQLLSMIAEGLFQKFPSLRVSVLEIGFTWVPAWMWDLDRNWKGIRREVPWLDRPPFEVLREHVRFTTSPLDAADAAELATVIEWMGSDAMLMFASDYPHSHGDDFSVLLAAAPDEARPKIMAGNARDWYRLP